MSVSTSTNLPAALPLQAPCTRYIAQGLGATAGVLCGWTLVIGYTLAVMAVACAFANYGVALLGLVGLKPSPIFLLAICIGITWYASYKDIQLSVVMMLVVEAVFVSLIFILGLIVWSHKGEAIDTAQLTLQGATPKGIALGQVIAVFSFIGFESATALGDEAKNPLKTIPNSLVLSTVLAGIFFIVMTYIEVLGFSGAATALDKSDAPLS